MDDDRSATNRVGNVQAETPNDAAENRQRLASNDVQPTFTADSGQPSAPVIAGEGDRLEQRAIRRKWNVPKEKRLEIIGRQIQIAVHGVKDGDAIRAFKAILLAERQDDLRTGKMSSVSQVNVTVQVAAREAAVFGDLAAFRSAAEHQAKQSALTSIDMSAPAPGATLPSSRQDVAGENQSHSQEST